MGHSTKKRRPYRLGRRAESTGETRQRIVEATFHLHSERGIAETSMTDIAERAGVSVGTVYHHFPSYADAIAACGAYTAEHEPAPTAAAFTGAATRRERIERLAGALFAYYERVPALESVRRDRHLARELDAFAREELRNRRALAAEAAGKGGAAALVAALLDVDVYRSLRREGFATADAAARVAALINHALDAAPGASRR
ncbi:MAG TPA: helix-turn-helix domain-containing protein [Steroidobacteraceae bacterium]|nr:helix-turn-helix domain-containing protein [Steroidobacteraceae bacterium]